MALVFPPTPNTGDTITDSATGALLRWDGAKWGHTPIDVDVSGRVPWAGGTMEGPLALQGFTANDAASGEVGEQVSFAGNFIAGSSPTWQNAAILLVALAPIRGCRRVASLPIAATA